MKSPLRSLTLAAFSAAAIFGFAGPAQAVYIVQWSNGGSSYVCDNGYIFEQYGDTTGTPMISYWGPGQPPC